MRSTHPAALLLFTVITAVSCSDPPQGPARAVPAVPLLDAARRDDPDAFSGGATTVFDAGATAFGHAAPNLDAAGLARHEDGDAAFALEFVKNTGLGPLFNNSSCEACHVGDGRGRPPLPGERFATMLFRASIPGEDEFGGPLGAGVFGGQLQLEAVAGFRPEASAKVTYVDSGGTFDDGDSFSLRVPRYEFRGIGMSLPGDLRTSPRIAPVVFGLGLLEAIPAAFIRGLADPDDADGDGISGRINLVYDAILKDYVVGRFGLKANVGTLLQQAAGAYNGDMGITSRHFPAENCEGEFDGCARHAPEVSNRTIADVAFYTQTLGVPARRRLDDPVALRGENVFYAAGCDGCHTPNVTTGVLAGVPAVSNQKIHPYTDLLLHDMGPSLADHRADFRATGREFRTPPLWGIGLVGVVNGHTTFLHDGRARNLLEAVLWHGGEATNARERVKSMSAERRRALIAFLESL